MMREARESEGQLSRLGKSVGGGHLEYSHETCRIQKRCKRQKNGGPDAEMYSKCITLFYESIIESSTL